MRYLLTLCTLIVIITGCKKETPAYPYNDVTGFAISDAHGDTLQAAISDNELIVYWPPFQDVPDSITPNIRLSARASITPATNVAVPFNDSTTYTVRAQNGSTKTFHLKVMINQPPIDFTINPLNTNATGQPLLYTDNGIYGYLQLGAQFFIEDTTQTSVMLVSANNTYPLHITAGTLSKLSLSCNLSEDIPEGMYKVRVKSGYRTFTNDQQVEVAHAPIPDPISQTLQKGGAFTLNGKWMSTVKAVTAYTANYEEVDFEVVNAADSQVSLKVPANAPSGTLSGYLYLTFDKGTVLYYLDTITITIP
jgi:hypothetical protein